MSGHKDGVDEAYEILSVSVVEREDVEDAIRTYLEKAYKRQDNAPGGAAKPTHKRYVGPWEKIDE